MSIDLRLNKLMPALSAQERAILILESWKAGEEEDPLWRSMMSPEQSMEFNRLIGLMNGSVISLGSYITVIEQLVEKMELRQCWLVALKLWDEQITEVERAVRRAVKEPITQSEYDAKQLEIDEAWVPLSELAEVLAGEYDGWTEADFEEVEGRDEPVITDAAWERVCALKERELRRLVASGGLKGRGRGAGLCLQEGAVNAWAGRTTAPCPDNVLRYRVLPDAEAGAVAAERAALDSLHEALESRRLVIKDEPEAERVLDRLAGLLRAGLAESFSFLWQEVAAIDLVVAEVAAHFDRADPLRPVRRESLDRMRGKLIGLSEQLVFLGVEVEMPDPDSETLQTVRHLARLD